jgi:MFS transporter, AAHS family, 4-hydroxybenzoate transporter
LIGFLLPESRMLSTLLAEQSLEAPRGGSSSYERESLVGRLFSGGLARVTALLWLINFLSLLTIYFINSWMPSMLHTLGATPQKAIIATTMYHVGGICGAILSGLIVGRFGVEKVFAGLLTVSVACLLVIGLSNVSLFVVGCLIFGSGIGISTGQLGINSLPGAIYPPDIRSTGTGWAIGIGRLGNIVGPLFGGLLLSLSWSPKHMFLALCFPTVTLALMLLVLRHARAAHNSLTGSPET